MSRSNVPVNQQGGWPPGQHPGQHPGEYPPQETTGRPGQRPPQQHPQAFGQQPGAANPQRIPQTYAQQPGLPPVQQPYPAYPDPNSPYADPSTAGRAAASYQQGQPGMPPRQATPAAPYAQPEFQQPADLPPTRGRAPQLAPQFGSAPTPGAVPGLAGAPSYAPQFDPYVPPSQPSPYAQPSRLGQPQPQPASGFGSQPAPYLPHPSPAYPAAPYNGAAGFDPATGRSQQPTVSQPYVPQAAQGQGFGQPGSGRDTGLMPPDTTQFSHTQASQTQPGYAQPGLSQLAPSRAVAQRPPHDRFGALQATPAPTQSQLDAAWRQQPQHPAAHGFDLGGFTPHAPAAGEEPSSGRHSGQPADLNFDNWPRQSGAGMGQQHPGEQYLEQQLRGPSGQMQPPAGFEPGFDHDTHADADLAYDDATTNDLEQAHEVDDEDHYEYEEPKKRSSLMLVGGALVASIIVGSGLALVYQKYVAPGAPQSAAVIKTDGAPSKVKPADAGGKQFANADSKVMGRLSDSGAPIATASTSNGAAAGDTESSAPRKVATIAVGRDGSFAAPVPTQESAPAAPSPAPSVSVPGLTLVDGFGRPQQRPTQVATATVSPPPPPPPPPQPVVVTPPPASVKPVVTARAAPPPAPPAEPDLNIASAVAEAPPTPPKRTAVPKKKVVDAYGAASATVPAGATPSVPVTATGANGYIAVLASVPVSTRSRVEALKQFADLQQKYGTVLSDKTPDVQEANLGEKGTYHRLLAGPPGSREQASHVCSQLKAAGYSGCWVTAY